MVSIAPAPRLIKTPLSEQAHSALKRQILDQQLQPGERLNIDSLARRLGVSTSPLREALVRLEAEGLVIFTINAGFSVAPVPDLSQMRQLLEFRLLIEAHCAREGARRATPETIATLEGSVAAMAGMRAAGVGYDEYQAYFSLEQAFHQGIVDSAGNQPIAAAYRGLDMVLYVARRSIIRHSGHLGSDEAVQEHRAIVAAFKLRDGEGAEAAMRKHLASALVRMEEATSSPI